ncbi:MAG: Polyprenyl synthetase family protein [Thermodesulfobacteriota bacterium]|nr:Polyprenyl synthetase family protein [Thermodesulfobacteriota bacterium]
MNQVNSKIMDISGFDFNSYISKKIILINKKLGKFIESAQDSTILAKAMNYSLLSGGKRIRPVLCIAAYEAVAEKENDVLPAACALEMIHAYSLIHDDLPAMDNDILRRGKPTCHVAFSEATAILAGDALLTLAFQILSSVQINNNDAAKWLNVINLISKAAGYMGMIEGQMRDINYENRCISLKELEYMHSLKTGALIGAAVEAGAILGNGSSVQINQLKIYAKSIGLAFQITDDILNVTGDPAETGKTTGTDKNRNKNTYPALLGVTGSEKHAKKLIREALHAIETFDNKADPLRAIALYIIERKK